MSSEPASPSGAAPRSIEELSAVLTEAASKRLVVGVRGGGSKQGWTAPGAAIDLEVDTRGLDRIVEHAAGDLVAIAQAGVALADLQEALAPAGQWLALDPPEASATVGGVVAAAASGPSRLRYGTPRDLLIGVTVVLADGTVAKSGGKVVKNVAGYDLGKLFTGSFGTLGVIAECAFRLHSRPPVRRVVTAAVDDPADAAPRVFDTGATPVALEWDGAVMTALVESIESAADVQAGDIAASLGGTVSDQLPAGFGRRPWPDDGRVGVKVTHRLGALRTALDAVDELVPDAVVRAQVGSGVLWLSTDRTDVGWLEPLRVRVADLDGQVVVVEAPAEVKQAIDTWGPVRGLALMRRIKDQFDPDHRMAPGCFVGGI